MKHAFTDSFLKILVIVFLIFGFNKLSVAQTKQALDVPGLEKAIFLNQQSGKPDFNGIVEKYEITFNDAELADKYKSQIISEVKKIEGVSDCQIDNVRSIITVTFPKEGEKNNRERNLERIKTAMAAYDLKLITYKEGTYYK